LSIKDNFLKSFNFHELKLPRA